MNGRTFFALLVVAAVALFAVAIGWALLVGPGA